MTRLFAFLTRFFRRQKPVPDPWTDLRAAAPLGVRDIDIQPYEGDANRPVALFKPPDSDLPVCVPLPRASLSVEGWTKWWLQALQAVREDDAKAEATLNWLRTQPLYLEPRTGILLSAYAALKEVGVETYGLGIEDAPGGHFLIGGVQLDGPAARGAMARGKPGDTNSHPFTGKKYPAGDRAFFRQWAAAAKETSE